VIHRADHAEPLYPQKLALHFVDKWWSLSLFVFVCNPQKRNLGTISRLTYQFQSAEVPRSEWYGLPAALQRTSTQYNVLVPLCSADKLKHIDSAEWRIRHSRI
jgi:hypothetical protein